MTVDSILFSKIKEKISERKEQLTTLKVEKISEPDKERLNGNQRLQEAMFIVGLLATIFIAVSLYSFNPADPSWSQTAWAGSVENAGGALGAWIGDTLFFSFGSLAYLLPVIIMSCTWIAFRKKDEDGEAELDLMMIGTRILGLLILFLTSCALADTSFDDLWYFSSGGVVGDVLTSITTPALNLLGSTLIFMFLWGAGLTLFTGVSWLTIVDNLGGWSLEGFRKIVNKARKTNDETYQVDTSVTETEEPKDNSFNQASRNASFSAVPTAVNAFETPKISASELSAFSQEPIVEDKFEEYPLNKFEMNQFDDSDNDPLFSSSSIDVFAEETPTNMVTEPVMPIPVEDTKIETTAIPMSDNGTEVTEALSVEAVPEKQEPESLDDGINFSMRSNATIEELDMEALDQDPLLSNMDAEKTFVKTAAASIPSVMVAGNEDISINNDDILSVDEELPHFPVEDSNIVESVPFSSIPEEPAPDYSVNEPFNEVTAEEIDDVSSAFITSHNEDNIEDIHFSAHEDDEIEEVTEELPVFNAIEKDEIEEVVEVEEIIIENEPTHSDADIAAFQALVAKEKATQAALQNPFLVNSEPNLPKPTAPMPTLDLLFSPDTRAEMESRESLEHTARLVEAKLADYKIKARVVDIFPGPVITRFELDLAPGVKVSRISGLATDLARSLSAMAVRVVEVIPGKPYVGLELPNFNRQTVFFSDVVGSEIFQNAKSPTTVVMGLDIAGEAVIADLAKMPHVLVAGTTGSGKSVGVNVMILSVLYKATPEDVRFIMIDPKMLELSIYEGIPHLLTEVVTDMKDAGNALRWCVGEMERRYKLMSALGVRNLQGFNDKLKMAAAAGHPIHDPLWKPGDSMHETPPLLEKLPSIIVIVDEFADLMMVVGKKVEELIARLAQKARAAGIHLILATQRPSVDVITGLIKANIPTRVAFTVSTKVDSRTILDQGGAESLLGMGDMLYLAPGSNHTVRVHGAFASDDDVHAVVNDWKARGRPNYVEAITKSEQGAESLLPGEKSDSEEELDQLFDQVVEFVTTSRRGSVSGVQRQFRIGYNRAARIVEQLEAHGIVSTPGHNGNREVIAPPPVGLGD